MPSNVVPPTVEIEVPTWKSPNELIHERINFDDTIWGFGLAGGAYYKTPLRITYVRPGSRAEMAHIYPGDVVKKINGLESSTLTLEQAHQMILESGVHLKITVTSPEDLEDNYFCYEDQLEEPSEEELKAKELKKKASRRFPKVSGKSSHWSLQWPWKCKRKIIYKESNCYLVPSKFEEKHKDTRKPEVKQDDTIVLDNIHSGKKRVTNEKIENKSNIIDSEKNKDDVSNDNINTKERDDNTELQSSDDKNLENNNSDQNAPGIKEKEDSAKAQNIPTNNDEKDGNTEQISSVDKNEDNSAIEHNTPVDNSVEDGMAEQNTSIDKTDVDVPAEQNNSEDNNVIEQNSFVDKKEEEDFVKTSDTIETNTNSDNIKFENGDIPSINESEKLSHISR